MGVAETAMDRASRYLDEVKLSCGAAARLGGGFNRVHGHFGESTFRTLNIDRFFNVSHINCVEFGRMTASQAAGDPTIARRKDLLAVAESLVTRAREDVRKAT